MLLLFLSYLILYSDLVGHAGKHFQDLRFMSSLIGKQIMVIRILPNTWSSKGNQTLKSGQLIKYNMRNIFPAEIEVERLTLDIYLFFKKF